MNERIKQLAMQADDGYTGDESDELGTSIVGSYAVAKFTELIVRECCEAMQDEDSYYGSWMTVVLKRHFGVE